MIHRRQIGAVNYLNTVPLVWGMLHGPQKEGVELSFSIPSTCAADVENGRVEIGLVPVAEIARRDLEIVPGVGISCRGAVRSILLFARVPWPKIRTLAADLSSRTSVELARVILREKYGVTPEISLREPALDKMLSEADAALIIGDPALQVNPEGYPFEWLDLGAEWFELTGLPMVFAAWAGKAGLPIAELQAITLGSYDHGRAALDRIIDQEHPGRGISKELASKYLRRHIFYEIGPKEQEGWQAFLELADLRSAIVEQGTSV